MIIPEYAIWLVPLAFYLADNCVLLGDHEFLAFEGPALEWRAKLVAAPFVWRRQNLYLLNPLCPFCTAYKLRWRSSTGVEHRQSDQAVRSLELWREAARPFRLISTSAFIIFFAVAPFVTSVLGVGPAILIVVPMHVTLVGLTAVHLRNPARRDTRWQLAGKLIELAVCPGYLINVCRRFSLQFEARNVNWPATIGPLLADGEFSDLADAIRFVEEERALFENDAGQE
jgi:hypothetical protein